MYTIATLILVDKNVYSDFNASSSKDNFTLNIACLSDLNWIWNDGSNVRVNNHCQMYMSLTGNYMLLPYLQSDVVELLINLINRSVNCWDCAHVISFIVSQTRINDTFIIQYQSNNQAI